MKNIIILAITAILVVPFAASAQKTTVTRVNRENTYRTVKTERRIGHAAPTLNQPRQKSVWYQGEIDFGLGIGAEMTGPIIETIHGIRITNYVFLGIGMGLHYPIEYGDPFVPLFTDLKLYYPVNGRIAPFLNVDAGLELCDGGMYFGAGAGLKYKRRQFSAGVRCNEADSFSGSYGHYSHGYGSTYYGYLKVGFTF